VTPPGGSAPPKLFSYPGCIVAIVVVIVVVVVVIVVVSLHAAIHTLH
jgi:hypothetical protein